MLVTLFALTNHKPTLSLHATNVKLDFGSALIEIDIEAFKDMIANLVMDGAAQGINFSIKEK
jgi:hypothetical protein